MLYYNIKSTKEKELKLYSERSAITGSFLLAYLDGINPDITVNVTLITTKIIAPIVGNVDTFFIPARLLMIIFIGIFIIVLAYLISFVVGGLLHYYLNLTEEQFLLKLLIIDIAMTVIIYLFSVIFKNASIYDPYWSVQPIVIVLALGIEKGFNIVNLLLSLV